MWLNLYSVLHKLPLPNDVVNEIESYRGIARHIVEPVCMCVLSQTQKVNEHGWKVYKLSFDNWHEKSYNIDYFSHGKLILSKLVIVSYKNNNMVTTHISYIVPTQYPAENRFQVFVNVPCFCEGFCSRCCN